MGITRPTGEQLRFRSQYTGDHVLDTYLESSEKGNRQLSDLLDDLFDSNGTFRAANFEFRFDASTDKIQFRAGNFASSTTGWTDITTFFNITGAFNASTTYNNFDLITLTNKDVYIVHGLSSGTTFADEAAVIASANTEKLVDVSEARDWASKTTGQVVSTDYSAKAYAVGGTGIDTTTGSAKDWAIKTSGTIGNTGEYSAKYWATSTAVTTVSSGIANINTVAASIANVNTVASDIANVNTVAGISANVTSVANIDTDVTTVAGISANTTTVAGIAPNVTTVAGVAANVTTVAGISGNVTTVASNNANVTTVATNVADVNTVAAEINNNNLQTVANDIAAVITLADDLNEATSEIDTVANSITNVDAVGNDITNVNTVATNIANVNTSATNIANVNTVAGISANVTTVAGISADVTTTATNDANITTVAGISSNVTTVAGISSDVTTVAGISADVTTAATNVVAFNNTYLGASATAPTADPDGSALDLGDLYFDTTTSTMKVYSASGWINAGSSVNGTADRFTYTATAAQTTFTGNDDNSNSLAYDAGFLDVYMNGVKLVNGSDFTATNGTSIVLASGAAANDTIEIIAYGTFVLADHLTETQSDARYVEVAGDTMTGNLSFGNNDKAIFGAGSDLQIYHDGNSKITDVGDGKLELHSNGTGVTIQKGATEYMAQFLTDGAVQLYHDHALKFATTSGGISVTGSATIDNYGGTSGKGRISIGNSGQQYIEGYDTGNAGSGSYLSFGQGTSERMRIDSSGNVGLNGVINPATTLDLGDGWMRGYGMYLEDHDGTKDHQFRLYVYGDSFAISRHTASSGLGAYEDELMKISSSGNVTFNDSGVDADFRVESDTNTHAFFVDGGADRIGLFESSPQQAVSLGGGNIFEYRSGSQAMFRPAANNNDHRIVASSFSGLDVVWGGATSTSMQRWQNGTGVVFNEDGVDQDFRVESNNHTHAFFVDAGADQVMVGASSGSGVYNGTGDAGVVVDGVSGTSNNITAMINNYGNANLYLSKKSGFTNSNLIYMSVNGTNTGSIQTSTSGVTYNTISDRRLKDNIEPIADGTEKLMAMKPVTHTWKADPEADAVHGFIAQEMIDVIPEAVSGDPDGEEMMSMDYGRITPVLVAALQDAHKKIEALEERLAELEAK